MSHEPSLQPCAHCQTNFLATRPWQRFCSSTCRANWHQEVKSPAVLKEIIKDLQAQIQELEASLEASQETVRHLRMDKGVIGRELAKTSHMDQRPKAFTAEYIREIVDGH